MKKMLKDAALIFRVIFTATLGQKEKDGKKKIAPKLGLLLLGLLFVIFVAFITVSMTLVAAPYDNGEVAASLIGISQLLVLVLGLAVAVDMLFFSKDTETLISLPVSTMSVFIAKMAMIFVAEFGLSAVISLPSLITFGIVKSVLLGFSSVGVGYFIYSVLATFLIPMIPILIISLLAMPVMYILSYVKKSEAATTIFSVVLTLCLVGIMLLMQFGLNPSLGGSADDAASMMTMFNGMDKAFIFNYPLKMALNVKSAASIGWFAAYFGEVLAVGAVAVLLSNLSYKRVLTKGLETGSKERSRKKNNNKETSFKSYGFTKTFLLKEIRTFFRTPTLLIGFLMSFIMFPLMGVIFGFAFGTAGVEVDLEGEGELEAFQYISQQMTFTMMLYIGFMITCTTNMLASVGFSREGKNFRVLKTLPISGATVTKLKLMLSFIQTAVSAALAAIGTLIAMLILGANGGTVAMATFLVFLISAVGGCGYDMLALSNDMQNINISWQNIAQITKRNPAFTGINLKVMLCGMAFMVVGMVLPIVTTLPTLALIGITAAIALVVALSFVVYGYLRLSKEPEKWFAEVEA